MLEAVRRGDYNNNPAALWNASSASASISRAGRSNSWVPGYLPDRESWLKTPAGGLSTWTRTSYNLLELVPSGAAGAPEAYAARLIPYLLMVMALTKRDPAQRPVHDHFTYRQAAPGPMPDLGDALLHGAATALRFLATQDEQASQPKLDLLAVAQYDSAQWLLYEALRANGERTPSERPSCCLKESTASRAATCRARTGRPGRLLEATTSHMSDDHFARLEAAILAYSPSWESRDSAGWPHSYS